MYEPIQFFLFIGFLLGTLISVLTNSKNFPIIFAICIGLGGVLGCVVNNYINGFSIKERSFI